jgi:hypothetical protein
VPPVDQTTGNKYLKAIMRILFLGCNRRYVNRHTELLLPLLAGVGKLTCFGPGFVSVEVLKQGIGAFVGRHAHFEVVVSDSFVLEWEKVSAREKPFAASYITFDPALYRGFAEAAAEFYDRWTGAKIFYQNLDLYNAEDRLLERLKGDRHYILGWGIELQGRVSEMDQPVDRFALGATDKYREFTEANSHRFISMPFFVGESEFSFRPLVGRPTRMSVPGADYVERVEARRQLGLEGIRWTLMRRSLNWVRRDRSAFWTAERLIGAQTRFDQQLEDSISCYVTGSCLKYLVRKYFEVPAKGSLMFCRDANGLEAVGFRHTVNCVVCPPAEIPARLERMIADGSAQEITDRGRATVFSKHCLRARTEQLKNTLAVIRSGEFRGSRWEGGEYKILNR